MIPRLTLLWISSFCPLAAQSYWPTTDTAWETLTPAAAGADPARLTAAINYAATKNSKALVVLKGGRIVVENHWQGATRTTQHVLFSATKGLTAALVGIAISEGSIPSTATTAATYLPEWSGVAGKKDITMLHLLSMTSGLEGGGQNLVLSQLARSEKNFAVQLPLVNPPGDYWDYNNPVYRLLFSILPAATGQALPAYTTAKILQPLGMTRTAWNFRTATLAGNTITNYEHLQASALDAARFGLCISRSGLWNQTQIIPSAWLASCLAPSQTDNPSYGLLWWLNGGASHLIPLDARNRNGPLCPDVPPKAYAALGNDDQKIYVIPSLDLVIVRLGNAAADGAPAISQFDNELVGRICRAFGFSGPVQNLQITPSIAAPGSFHLHCETWSGRGYRIERSTNFSSPWIPLTGYEAVIGDGLPLSIDLPIIDPAAFFRATSTSLIE